MKIYVLIILFFSLSCNEKVKTVKKQSVTNGLSKIKDTLHSKYEVTTVNLPYGSKIIAEYKFPKKWRYLSALSDNYNPNNINSNSKKINYIDSTFNSKHSLSKNWVINYMIDTTNFDNNLRKVTNNINPLNFRLIEILPKIQKINVVLRNYKDKKRGIYLIDLLTINQSGEVIDFLNIYYSISGDFHTSYKFFYINKQYKITIKKFEVYEDQTNQISNKKFIIKKTGKIQQIEKL